MLAGLAGSLLCYLAQPPLGLGLLAWVGPTPWLLLARAPQLPGRRPYRALWMAGTAYWLAAVYWMCLPFWANFIGFIPMALYLGAYLPAFVALVRAAIHRFRVPLWLAAPVVWTGFEWLRGHLLTGFFMASLAHTQVEFPLVIQVADLAGEYAVTFLIVLVGSSIASALPLSLITPSTPSAPGRRDHEDTRPRRILPTLRALAPAAIALVVAMVYGESQQTYFPVKNNRAQRSKPTVAIIQTNMLCDWKGTRERDQQAMDAQIEQSVAAASKSSKRVDLIVWPETMFRQPLFVKDPDRPPAEGALPAAHYTATPSFLRSLTKATGAALIVGVDRVVVSQPDPPAPPPDYDALVYNAAVAVDRAGELQGYYAKMHLLPFGEYIPFASWLPMLSRYVPITGKALWGPGAAAFTLDGVTYSPNICYETVLPHLIRRQVNELAAAGRPPDVLVNLTNDSWFWGSSELDMHLACGVFRAVEMRRPLLIAANRGLSAYVDETGRVVAVTDRDVAAELVVEVRLPGDAAVLTRYARSGDWLPLACLAAAGALAVAGVVSWSASRATAAKPA